MTNVWGLGDDGGSSGIANINSRLNSKVNRNGDEMHGDLQMNNNNINGLDINPVNVNNSSAVSYGVLIHYLTEAFSQFLQPDGSNVMRGDLLVDSTNNDSVAIGCNNFGSAQKGFAHLLGNINNQLLYNTLIANQPVVLYTSDGFEVRLGNTDKYLSVGTHGDPRIIAYKQIRLVQGDPVRDNDAATKRYVDNKARKCQSGLIPNLTANLDTGYEATASSEFNANYRHIMLFVLVITIGQLLGLKMTFGLR